MGGQHQSEFYINGLKHIIGRGNLKQRSEWEDNIKFDFTE